MTVTAEAAGLTLTLITTIGIIVSIISTGKKDKNSILKEAYEQRLIYKDEIIANKDSTISRLVDENKTLKAALRWYQEGSNEDEPAS